MARNEERETVKAKKSTRDRQAEWVHKIMKEAEKYKNN